MVVLGMVVLGMVALGMVVLGSVGVPKVRLIRRCIRITFPEIFGTVDEHLATLYHVFYQFNWRFIEEFYITTYESF
jgi:hypothetical protein